jgi:hypothetical protein
VLATLTAVPSAHRGKPVGKSASSIDAEIDPLINGVSVVLAGAESHSRDNVTIFPPWRFGLRPDRAPRALAVRLPIGCALDDALV